MLGIKSLCGRDSVTGQNVSPQTIKICKLNYFTQ